MNSGIRRNWLKTCLLGLFGIGLGAETRGAQAARKVVGKVVNRKGEGINDLDVVMYAGDKASVEQTKGDGDFSFDSPEVTFRLVFKEPQAATTVLEVRQLAGKQAQQIVIDLGREAQEFEHLYIRLQALESVVEYALQAKERPAKLFRQFPYPDLLARGEDLRKRVEGSGLEEKQKKFLNQKAALIIDGIKSIG